MTAAVAEEIPEGEGLGLLGGVPDRDQRATGGKPAKRLHQVVAAHHVQDRVHGFVDRDGRRDHLSGP